MVLGWVAWVTVFVWGLKGGLFGWEGVGELFATHAYFKLNLQEQSNNTDRGGLAKLLQLTISLIQYVNISQLIETTLLQ